MFALATLFSTLSVSIPPAIFKGVEYNCNSTQIVTQNGYSMTQICNISSGLNIAAICLNALGVFFTAVLVAIQTNWSHPFAIENEKLKKLVDSEFKKTIKEKSKKYFKIGEDVQLLEKPEMKMEVELLKQEKFTSTFQVWCVLILKSIIPLLAFASSTIETVKEISNSPNIEISLGITESILSGLTTLVHSLISVYSSPAGYLFKKTEEKKEKINSSNK